MRKVITLMLLLFCVVPAFCQELQCNISVNTQKLGSNDDVIFKNFKNTTMDFMNNTKWTELNFDNHEKIICSFNFLFNSQDGNNYSVDLSIQSKRPIFGTSINTSILNVTEKINFKYDENDDLIHNESMFQSNLEATLSFWAYVIIGMDADSFSKKGGSLYFRKAQNVVSLSQGVFGLSWSPGEDLNHWGWSHSLNDQGFPEMRMLNYQYNRMGLDVMYKDVEKGINSISESLDALSIMKKNKPTSPLLKNFFNTKIDELANIYSKSSSKDKNKIYNLLLNVYPASSNKLDKIKDNVN